MSVAGGVLQAALEIVALLLVRRFDLRGRFDTITGPGSLKFDPGAALLGGAIAAIVSGLAFAAWSVLS